MIDEDEMMHGLAWDGQDVAGWIASEKLDGIRAYWDGSRMWSRSGREIEVPAEMRAELPAFALDGEIWAGRGGYVTARNATNHGQWSAAVRYVVFDAPGHAGTYAARIARARELLSGCARVAVVESRTVSGIDDAAAMMREIQSAGGEGVMLQFPHSAHYRPGRWQHTLKLKRKPSKPATAQVGLCVRFGLA